MGQQLELGDQAGKAAPGEFGPRALLTTAGMVMMKDPTTGLVVAKYPPGFLIADDAGGAGTPLNVTAETSVLNAVLTNALLGGALPAVVSARDMVHLRAWGHAIFGATGTLLLNVYAGGTLGTGGTKIAAGSASGNYSAGVARGWELDLKIRLLTSTTVSVSGFIMPRSINGAGFTGIGAAGDLQFGGNDLGDAITVSALPLVLDIRATCSTNTATTQVSCKGAEVRYYPKNY